MSRDFYIPEISPTAGETLEGHAFGRVNQSVFAAVLSNATMASNVYAVRKDVNGGSSFVDISTSVGCFYDYRP